MKYLQTTLLKILTINLLILIWTSGLGQSAQANLAKADSLFKNRQFTQSLNYYQQLLSEKAYTPAMLLKMAYIQEGLGQIGSCIYYLSLYEQSSAESGVSRKIGELADKYKLQGYSPKNELKPLRIFSHYRGGIMVAACVLSTFLAALAFYQKRKGKSPLVAALFALLFALGIGAYANFYDDHSSGIIKDNNTYLMTAPSAAASVWKIVEEGHKVKIVGEKDVWLKIVWEEKELFLKKSSVLPLTI